MNKPGPHILTAEHLSVGYNKPILHNFSAEFTSGITGIIGNNGKGKTSLLKTVAGLLEPLSGRISFDGNDITAATNQQRARVLSFNFSVNPVSFPVSVYELVAMGRYPYLNQWATLQKEDRQHIRQAMEICGISRFASKMVNALSDGERQKVFIAKSIAQQTPLMLFDEPTAFLDYASKKYFFGLLKELVSDAKKVILVSSHDIDFLTIYCDHLLMIEDDEEIRVGETQMITATSYFKKHFSK